MYQLYAQTAWSFYTCNCTIHIKAWNCPTVLSSSSLWLYSCWGEITNGIWVFVKHFTIIQYFNRVAREQIRSLYAPATFQIFMQLWKYITRLYCTMSIVKEQSCDNECTYIHNCVWHKSNQNGKCMLTEDDIYWQLELIIIL